MQTTEYEFETFIVYTPILHTDPRKDMYSFFFEALGEVVQGIRQGSAIDFKEVGAHGTFIYVVAYVVGQVTEIVGTCTEFIGIQDGGSRKKTQDGTYENEPHSLMLKNGPSERF